MAHRQWTVFVDGNRHEVELEHAYWSGRRVVRVDGEEVLNRRQFMDMGSVDAVPVGSKTAVVVVRTNGLTFRYDLVIDGISQTTNEEVRLDQPLYAPNWGKRPPKWLGGHLSPLEDNLLATALGAASLGLLYMMLSPLLLKGVGLFLIAAGVVTYFVRQKTMFLVLGSLELLAAFIPLFVSPRAWKLLLLPAVLAVKTFATYRKNLSAQRPAD